MFRDGSFLRGKINKILLLGPIMKSSLTLILVCGLTLSSCAFYPTTVADENKQECKLISRQLTLKAISLGVPCQGDAASLSACLLALGVITGSSAVVSGSIVLAGNTLHWLEKQGKCDDSFLRQALKQHHQQPRQAPKYP